jgi:hypothetical protein
VLRPCLCVAGCLQFTALRARAVAGVVLFHALDQGGRPWQVAITYYELRYLTAGKTKALPTAAWLVTFPRGAENHATERRISRVFDWLQAPYAGGHFLGGYGGLATDGRSAVRPLFVETNAIAPQDSTDAYSGLPPPGRTPLPPHRSRADLSRWQRRHQATARRCHYRRRTAGKNWRALARHLGRRENMSDTVQAVAGLLSHQQTADLTSKRQMKTALRRHPRRLTAYRARARK